MATKDIFCLGAKIVPYCD